MQNYDPQDPSFESALKAIWVDLEPHFREESELAALEEALSPSESETLGKKYENVKELLQKPYGPDGVPDERTLSAILDMSLQDLMVKLGVRWEWRVSGWEPYNTGSTGVPVLQQLLHYLYIKWTLLQAWPIRKLNGESQVPLKSHMSHDHQRRCRSSTEAQFIDESYYCCNEGHKNLSILALVR